jgi:hypothetical protein
MTNSDPHEELKARVTRKLQDYVTGKVQNEMARTGASFSNSWGRLKQADPTMFDSLDEIGSLSDADLQTLLDLPLKTGSKSNMPFHGMPPATAPNNVPSEPGSKPPGQAADDPRAGGDSKYVSRPKDERIVGSWVRDLVASVGKPVRVQAERGTICVRNPYSWGD